MKNLFTHQVVEDSEAYEPFENPYMVSRVSAETEAMMNYDGDEDGAPKLTEEEKEDIKSKEKKYLMGILVSFALSLISFMLATRVEALENTPILFLPIAGMIVALIFLYKIKQLQWKKNGMDSNGLKDVDFEAIAKNAEESNNVARAELGIPDDDEIVEILPYGYKKKGDKQVPAQKARQFDNTPVSMHVRDGKLCIFDSVALYEIPLGDIKGYRVYDEDYRIEFWLKEGEPTDEQYKEFNLKKCGLLEYKTHTYYGVEVVSESTGEVFEMLVPGYDFEELKKVIDVEALA